MSPLPMNQNLRFLKRGWKRWKIGRVGLIQEICTVSDNTLTMLGLIKEAVPMRLDADSGDKRNPTNSNGSSNGSSRPTENGEPASGDVHDEQTSKSKSKISHGKNAAKSQHSPIDSSQDKLDIMTTEPKPSKKQKTDDASSEQYSASYDELKILRNERLRCLCEDMGLAVSGNKDKLISNLLQGGVSLQQLTLDDLKEICNEFSLQVSGNKDALIRRIVNARK